MIIRRKDGAGDYKLAAGVFVILALLQLFSPPVFASPDGAGKAILFAGAVTLWAGYVLVQGRAWYFGRGGIFLLVLLSLLLLSALASEESFSGLLAVGFVGSGFLFVLLLLQLTAAGIPLFDYLTTFLKVVGLALAGLGLFEFFHYRLFGPTRGMLLYGILPPDLHERVVGPYGQPNHLALVLLLGLLAFLYSGLHERDMGAWCWVVWRALPVLLLATVFFLARSRGGVVALGATWGWVLLLVARGKYLHGDRGRRVRFFCLCLCLPAAFFLVRLLTVLPLEGVASTPISTGAGAAPAVSDWTAASSLDSRLFYWGAALLIFLKSPILGVGLGNYRFALPSVSARVHELVPFIPFETREFSSWAHSEFFQLLCEGGMGVGILVLVGIFLLLRPLVSPLGRSRVPLDPQRFYVALAMLAFFVQSSLSWCLRNPAIFGIFLVFLAVHLSREPMEKVVPSSWGRAGAMLLVILVAVFNLRYGLLEVEIREFRETFLKGPLASATQDRFYELVRQPYARYELLAEASPLLLGAAFRAENRIAVRKVLPFLAEIAQRRGTARDWVHLALAHQDLGDWAGASRAIDRAVEQDPTLKVAWDFRHYLNALQAAEATGADLQSFYPLDPDIELQVQRYFYGRDNI